MQIDPHTIQTLLTKVRDQLRCPQCRKKVDVNMEALKVMGDNFAVMQLKCSVCDAHIMLHATVTGDGIGITAETAEQSAHGKNASTKIAIDPADVKKVREALQDASGSFMDYFTEEQ